MLKFDTIEPKIKNNKISNLKSKDLTGKLFGKLVVVKKHEKRSINNRILWECICECGNTCIIAGDQLNRGSKNGKGNHTRSCGCLRNNAHNKIKDRNYAIWKQLYNSTIIKRSKLKKWKTDIDFDYFKKLSESPCNYCGLINSNISTDRIDSKNIIYFNGIDRIDSSKEYTISNSVPCCKYCNTAKNTMNVEEFISYIERVYHFNKTSTIN